jgi:TonB-linked SusC/RagA family outer membrane protein
MTKSLKKGFASIAILASSFFWALSLSAQNPVTVSGQIVDEANEPVIGAGVMQKGTSTGAVTDLDGYYTLRVPEGSTLVFSCIGYLSQEIVVPAGGGTLNLTLATDNMMIEETVVVGYGVQKKSDLTGSISSVKEEDLTHRTITDASQALQGKTAGVTAYSSSAAPGSSPSIQVRGVSSNGSSNPLYVVDGRITDGIGTLDPNDIESMEILKDGASAAIYGARAGNGVILITTKKGRGDGKVSYEFQNTIQSFAHIPKVMNAHEYMDYYKEAGVFTQDYYDTFWDGKTDTNWVKAISEKADMQRHTLTFQQGSDRGSIYTSVSYLNQDGMMKGKMDTYKRLSSTINGTWQFKPWLEMTTNNTFTYTKRRAVGGNSAYGNPMVAMITLDPLTPPTWTYDQLPDALKNVVNNTATYGELLSDGNGNYYSISRFDEFTVNGNPFISFNSADPVTQTFSLGGSTALNLKPIKNLVITSRIGYRVDTNENRSFTNDYYPSSTDYHSYASATGTSGNTTYYQWENFANYNITFGEHSLGAMVGTSYSQNRTFSISGTYRGSDGDLGFISDEPNYHYWAYATPSASKSLTGNEPLYTRNWSYFGRVNWNYANRYLLQVSLRADSADSSVLPFDNRWGYFPAVSAGWTVSNEPFMQSTKNWLSFLKVRLSWGQNGSTASLGNHSYTAVMSTAQTYDYPTEEGYTSIKGMVPTATGNNRLRWETSEQFNVGLDARFLQDRLTFSVDYFNKKTKDLIVSGAKPSLSIGLPPSPINAGNVSNSGFEFEIGWQEQKGDFHYSVRANASTLKNKVTYIDNSVQAIDGTAHQDIGTLTRFEAGYPAWYFYGYTFEKVDPNTGDPVFADLDGSGDLSDGDKGYIGSGIPKFTYGLTFTAGWKGFDLLVFASGALKTQIYAMLDRPKGAGNKLTYFTQDRWTQSHTVASHPRAGADNYQKYLSSTANVIDGSYLKIKQIQLGYTVPTSFLNKFKVSDLRIYFSLDDFFTFTKYPGFDPEVIGSGKSVGVDYGTYPTSKKLVFGVNIGF